jgi:ribonuclease HII
MQLVAGVDEAGVGPLAGPVVASAVILDCRNIPEGIDDSKRVAAAERARLHGLILASAIAVGIGIVPPEVIDRNNILRAALQAMAEAVADLGIAPDCVVVDGRNVPNLDLPVLALVDGDSRCLSVAAASIVAKVTRDMIMLEADKMYPHYLFGRNKGYGTRGHLEALRRYGPTRLHRFSFEPVAAAAGERNGE